MKIQISTLLLIGVSVVLAVLLLQQCNRTKNIESLHLKNLEALNDTLYKERLDNNSLSAMIKNLVSDEPEDMENIVTRDEEINKLKKLVQEYKDKLDQTGSVTTGLITTIAKLKSPTIVYHKDTIITDSIVYVYPTYYTNIDSSQNRWIQYEISASKDTIHNSTIVHNEFDMIVGYDKKAKSHFTNLIIHNPYSDVKSLRTYQKVPSLQKRWGIGPIGGMGLNGQLKRDWFVGVGLSYDLIKF